MGLSIILKPINKDSSLFKKLDLDVKLIDPKMIKF